MGVKIFCVHHQLQIHLITSKTQFIRLLILGSIFKLPGQDWPVIRFSLIGFQNEMEATRITSVQTDIGKKNIRKKIGVMRSIRTFWNLMQSGAYVKVRKDVD